MPGLTEHGTAGASNCSPSPSPEKSHSPGETSDTPVVTENSCVASLKDEDVSPQGLDTWDATRKRKCQPPPVIRVEPGSLYHIMQQNAGTSLFIRPVAWTDVHSRSLGAVWADQPRIDQPVPLTNSPRPESERRLSREASVLVRELNCIFAPGAALPFYSVFPIRHVLSTLYPESGVSAEGFSNPEMHLWFGGRAYRDAVRVQCLWTWPYPKSEEGGSDTELEPITKVASSFMTESTEPALSFDDASDSKLATETKCGKAMLGYIGRKQLAAIRGSLFRVIPGPRRSNEPVLRLQARRCQMLVPSNPDHDPHFVAIMIAMAQHHIYPQYRDAHFTRSGISRVPLPCEPEFQDVTVRILTNDNDTADFLVYKATVTAVYLRRLHDPTQSIVTPSADGKISLPGLHIEVTRVPTWPVLGLKERLGLALGREVVGTFDPENPEMWKDKSTPPSPAGNDKKRGRQENTLPMFNGAFDEDPPENRPAKKTRLGESGGPPEIAI